MMKPIAHDFFEKLRPDSPSVQATLLPVKSLSTISDSAKYAYFEEIVSYACTRLLCTDQTQHARLDRSGWDSRSPLQYPHRAQLALVDVRLCLDYETGIPASQKLQEELVAHHMRTAFSVLKDGTVVESGYPSEPILVQAAASQLQFWRTNEDDGAADSVLSILAKGIRVGHVRKQDFAKTLVRALLMLAWDFAVKLSPHFYQRQIYCQPILLIWFIQKLFQTTIADAIFDSYPDNVPPGMDVDGRRRKFRDMFAHSMINASHWTRWKDTSALTKEGMMAAFIRGTGVIFQNFAIIPVLIDNQLEKGKLFSPDNFTALVLCLNNDLDGEPERVGLLPESEPGCCPYIVLHINLGNISGPPSPPTEELVRDRLIDPKAAAHLAHEICGPRYRFFAYGCSPKVYKVVSENDRKVLREMLDASGLLPSHSRQDKEFVDAALRQKPYMSVRADSFHWVDLPALHRPACDKEDPTAHGYLEISKFNEM
jgi:hypothetical protein